ncbi:MAG: hypothetical protein ACEY3F_08040 [Wolbachia sp.]
MQLYLCFLTIFVDTRLSAFQARSIHSEYNMLHNVMPENIINKYFTRKSGSGGKSEH